MYLKPKVTFFYHSSLCYVCTVKIGTDLSVNNLMMLYHVINVYSSVM